MTTAVIENVSWGWRKGRKWK